MHEALVILAARPHGGPAMIVISLIVAGLIMSAVGGRFE